MKFSDLPPDIQNEIINSFKPNAPTPARIVLCGLDAGGGLMFDPLLLSPRSAIKRNPGAFISLMMDMREAYQEYSAMMEREAAKRAQMEMEL